MLSTFLRILLELSQKNSTMHLAINRSKMRSTRKLVRTRIKDKRNNDFINFAGPQTSDKNSNGSAMPPHLLEDSPRKFRDIETENLEKASLLLSHSLVRLGVRRRKGGFSSSKKRLSNAFMYAAPQRTAQQPEPWKRLQTARVKLRSLLGFTLFL